jgi:hypothetical protein
MNHFINVEPPYLREAIGEQVWKDAITRRILVYLEK